MRPIDLKREERHMLPRWLPSQLVLGGESGGARIPPVQQLKLPPGRISRLQRDLKLEDLGILEDGLAYSFATGCIAPDELMQLARRIQLARLSSGHRNNELADALAETGHSIPAGHLLYQEAFDRSIGWLRSRLKYDESDALAWIDLGYLNTLRGDLDEARRNVLVALQLEPQSPFIVRSSGRFLVHDDDPERALKITRKALKLGANPAFFSTEIALSNLTDVSPQSATEARRLISNARDFGDDRIAETAIALATEEAKGGSRHRLKKILSKEWKTVDENVHSQLLWVSNFADLPMPNEIGIKGNTSEASFRSSYISKDYKSALSAAQGWLEYQPFSTAPASYGSYIAATYLSDYSKGREMCEAALYSNPDDFCLLNNAAFCSAKEGDISRAQAYLALAQKAVEYLGETEQAVFKATQGLVAYRIGDAEIGTVLYRGAVQYFERNELRNEAALATAMWAEEAAHAGDASVQTILEKLEQLLEADLRDELRSSLKKLRTTLRREQKPAND